MFKLLIMPIIFFLVMSGCSKSSSDAVETVDVDEVIVAGENSKLSRTHLLFNDLYQQNIDATLQRYFESNADTVSEKITRKSTDANSIIDQDVYDVVFQSIEQAFYRSANKKLKEQYGNEIGALYQVYLDENRALEEVDEEGLKSVLDEYNSAKENSIQASLMTLLDETITRFLDESNTHKSISLFEDANKTAQFKKKMHAYFTAFNPEKDYNSSKHTPPSSHHFYNKLETTNTFDGETLLIHKSIYNDGRIEKIDTRKVTVNFPPRDGIKPKEAQYYVAVSADLNGDGHHSLLVLKEYENGYFYPYELTYDGQKKSDVAIKPMPYVTDVTTGDIDNDGADEIIIAQGSPYNRVSIFEDAALNFHIITTYSFFDVEIDDGVIRLASGDVDADGYSEFAALSYNTKAESWKSQLYMWSLESNNTTLLKKRVSHTFAQKMPGDILFADLHHVDKIDLFVVELDKKTSNEPQGYEQPELSGSDDFCRYFMQSVNTLNVYEFAYNFSTNTFDEEKKKITIENNTYDKKYNNGTECLHDSNGVCIYPSTNGTPIQKDGVICNVGGCKCDERIMPYLPAYHLYIPEDHLYKPLYATAYHEALDAPSKLDIDGLSYSFAESAHDATIKPAAHYEVTYEHKHEGDTERYTPVRSNSDENSKRRYITHIKEGQRYYTNSPIPHAIASASNIYKNQKASVYRHYDETWPHIRRVSTYAHDSKILSFQAHHLLYSKPTFAYILTSPPPVGNTTMHYSLSHCNGTTSEDTKLNGPIVGASIGFGLAENFVVAESEESLSLNFETLQSSGSVEEHKRETCMEKGHSVNNEEDAILYYYTNIVDSYLYKIIEDFAHPENIGKMITVNQKRVQSALPYEAQRSVKELYSKLDAEGITPEIDIRSLVRHTEGNLSTYDTQETFNNIIDNPADNLSDKFNYTHIWYTKENVLIPNSGGIENSYTRTVSHTYGTEEHDNYKSSVEFKAEFEEGFLIDATEEVSVELGWEWSFYHERLSESSTETSYTLDIEGTNNVDNLPYTYVGLYSYIARPKGKKCFNKNSIPLNRQDFSDLNKDDEIDCKPPVLVIDYWLTNQPQSSE